MAPADREPTLDAHRFDRTPVGSIIGLAVCSVAALLALALVVLHGPVPTLVSLGLAVLPVLLLAGVLYLDRLEPELRALLLLVFGAGAVAAALTLLAGHALGGGLPTIPPFGPRAAGVAAATPGAVIGGAVAAESLKGVVLVALLRFRRAELDGAHDGVVYGSIVGLGFALVVNLHAYLAAAAGACGRSPRAGPRPRRCGRYGTTRRAAARARPWWFT
jgi:protease PrsW